MLSIVESKRNKPTLLLDTFRYTQDKILNTTIYWKCENRSCPGRAIQYGSNPPSMKKLHNHDGDEMKCKQEEFRMKLKRRVEDSPQAVKRIYREEIISLHTNSPEVTPFIPMFHEMKNSLYKTRNTSYPPAPRTIDDVNIEGIWSKTLSGEQFILHNSKHLIFGTSESLKQLSKSDNDHLFFDGTFKSCPNPFYQLYSVHSVNSELSTPKLYTLLPDKKAPTYISIFNSILNLCHMNNIGLNPKFITIDFEQAAIIAIKLIFPNAIIKGCNFHFNKCIYSKLQDLGFQSAFINKKSSDLNEINIRNLYKKTCALAFMPPQEIGKLWVTIMDEYQDIENIEGFYDYVTNTWIDDDALFDYVLWNYYNFKSLRTNNHVEGWHHRLNNDLNNVVHPHFYLFIRAIQNDYAYNSAISSRHLATGILPPRKKLFVNRNARLQNLEERFKQQTLTLNEYLEKVMQLIGIKKY
ncbi:unnamed protein product [Rotaria sordida]|uniref:MULE transposase domain-containing protein n=1 Tax=Rotaria sordida TaxID=392033 RepID=A0A815EU07_9BILA|nr:unnamed protein product [Rotaria sordida]CAF1316132.1 unnamed protein product [Rotaria sordida]